MSSIIDELEAILNVPFKIWFCDKCPRSTHSVEWHDDNAKCLHCGRTRVQSLIDKIRKREPPPATQRLIDWMNARQRRPIGNTEDVSIELFGLVLDMAKEWDEIKG